MKILYTTLALVLCLCGTALAAQEAPKPLPGITDENVEVQLGMALAADKAWTLNRIGVQDGALRTVTYALSESAACYTVNDKATGQVLRINFLVRKRPDLYKEKADHVFNNEVNMAIRAAGFMFLELRRNPGLADQMQQTLGMENSSIREGKTIVAKPDDATVSFVARFVDNLYGLAIEGN